MEKLETTRNIRQETLVKADGKKSQVDLELKEKIGAGAFGEVYKVKAAMHDRKNIEKVREKILALKEFRGKDNSYIESDKTGAEHSLEVFQRLSEAEVDTWTTFRKVEGKDEIVMTYGEHEGDKLVSTSDASKSKNTLLDEKYDLVRNLEQVLIKAVENALKAGKNGIEMRGDSWMAIFHDLNNENKNFFYRFFGKKKEGVIRNIFIGDFDNIELGQKNDMRVCEARNLFQLYFFAESLLSQFTTGKKEYYRMINKIIVESAKKIDEQTGNKGRWERSMERAARQDDKMFEQGYWESGERYFKE